MLIREEKLDCDWRRTGRFHAAHNRRQYDALARFAGNQPKGLEVPMEMVPKAEQHREIASDLYHGGAVYPRHGALHPGKYHLELLRIARAAGVQVVDQCKAQAIERDGSEFRVRTAKGTVTARDVVLATNGYSGPLSPWHRRRVIPIGSYIIATEPRPAEEMKKLIPHDRMVSDTRRVVFYYRLSPDQRSILFGGRVAYMETNPLVSAPRLHKCLSDIFPSMKDAHVTHSWMGFVAYTFDTLPHVGKQDGIHYAMGYCGSGVSLATYFGMRVGQQVLGRDRGQDRARQRAVPDAADVHRQPVVPGAERVVVPDAGQAADLAVPSTPLPPSWSDLVRPSTSFVGHHRFLDKQTRGWSCQARP